MIVASLSICLVIISFAKMIPLVWGSPPEAFRQDSYSDAYGALWQGLNTENKYASCLYLILAGRGILLGYLSVVFDRFPYVQLAVSIAYQGLVLSLYFWGLKLQPIFVEGPINMFSCFVELLLIAMLSLMLGSKVVYNNVKGNIDSLMLSLGWGIVGIGLLIQTLQVVYSVHVLYQNRRKVVETIKRVCYRLLNLGSSGNSKLDRVQVWPMAESMATMKTDTRINIA